MINNFPNPFLLSSVEDKLKGIEQACHRSIQGHVYFVPPFPERDLSVITQCLDKSKRPGLSEPEGQAKLLHDVANIELQAMELAFRTLVEFPEAPKPFREELVELTLQEAHHFKICLEEIHRLGYEWGYWDVHLHLWNSVSPQDSLLDRILIVHRYLEGSGLDASQILLSKLSGVINQRPLKIIELIATEEEEHVLFGSSWYKQICLREGLNPQLDFDERMRSVIDKIPKRSAKMNWELRRRVGFTDSELKTLEQIYALKQN